MNFFIKGTTTASSDERTAIVLNIAERAYEGYVLASLQSQKARALQLFLG
jgi:hypothetical protein